MALNHFLKAQTNACLSYHQTLKISRDIKRDPPKMNKIVQFMYF